MRVRMFKPRFAPLVEVGLKRQTIRPQPKRMPKAGDKESWRKWTGKPYRTPQKELSQVTLTAVRSILIVGLGIMAIDGRDLTWTECEDVARRDGFQSLQDMTQWFLETHSLPFRGIIITAI